MPHYSLLITSCNRFDLLKSTLDTFIETGCGGVKPRECIIVDDSTAPMPKWLSENIHYYSANLGKVTFISNGGRMGQIYSADRLWSLCSYDYAFWMEDDWDFVQSNFMQESFDLLEKYPKIITVSLRGDTGWHPLIDHPPYEGCKIAMPNWRGGWGGFTFNCGARRKSDYLALSSYGRQVAYGSHGLGHELQLSQQMLDKGYLIADLNRPIVTHTGAGRSRAIEPLPAMPKILIAIPACFEFDYGKWESEQSPAYDQSKAYNGVPYGTDIHISGRNPRLEALRDTWLRDIKPFKAHVDYKFFYGKPETGYPREALADEVFLSCPDDYEHLPYKTIEIAKYALENDYDFVFKCDDDTAVYVDRLVKELMSYKFDYAGYEHSGVCTGGPGYWLSKRAMRAVANFKPYHWAEDVTVGHCMTAANINAIMLSGHRPGGSSHWFFGERFNPAKLTEEIVTMHAVAPREMREWYAHKEGK